ncbi:AEC family transporter [Fructilactobacillus myrtifloralis]|uniref:AEC family transporter n=1 Tax=Fructilactobacillus myrtifloralis TaxID=2940301 RepID=A0ABY5BRM4_9LACO|nr:AEC family transporter [Fructilactobacillus myrtifloralis]USS85566.1 AEC family transporter [Fructilactobacillus myrtifloralis]
MQLTDAFVKTLTNPRIVSAITSTILIILLGFWLRKRAIFSETFGKTLAKVTLTVAIPALALNSFMAPIDGKTLAEGMNVLLWGFLIIVIFLLLAPVFYLKLPKSERDVMGILTTFGSTTFFGIPVVGAVLGPKGIMYSSIFNIGYRVFLYSYAYIKMSGLKLEVKNVKKMLLNPVVIATFLGLILWLTQGDLPHVTVPTFANGVLVTGASSHSVSIFRIDQTALWLWTPLNYLAQLASPLAWLSIGITLGSLSFKQAAKSKLSWYYGFNKVILVPFITLGLTGGFAAIGILPLSFVAIATMVIMMATPTATVASAYAISFNRDAVLASNAALISTVLTVIMMPIWIAILQVIHNAGWFH